MLPRFTCTQSILLIQQRGKKTLLSLTLICYCQLVSKVKIVRGRLYPRVYVRPWNTATWRFGWLTALALPHSKLFTIVLVRRYACTEYLYPPHVYCFDEVCTWLDHHVHSLPRLNVHELYLRIQLVLWALLFLKHIAIVQDTCRMGVWLGWHICYNATQVSQG